MFYSIVGTSEQFCGPEHLMPVGSILMECERPTPASIAQADGTWLEVPPDPEPVVLSSDTITVADADILLTASVEKGSNGQLTSGAILAQWLINKMEL